MQKYILIATINLVSIMSVLPLGIIRFLRHTLTRRATLVRPHNWMRTAGHRAGYEHTHLPSGVAIAVTAAVMPAVTFLVSVPVGGEAIVGHW